MVLYLIAVLMAAVLVIALWRLLGPDQVASRDRTPRPRPPRRPRGLPGSLGGGSKSVPPDDNPEFLRELQRRSQRPDDPPARDWSS